MELIAFASGKGGTGKTLMASCLGYSLIKAGHRVLMIDADPATDGLSLFLLGKNGMRQISNFEPMNTFTGMLRHFQQAGEVKWEPRRIHRNGSDQEGDHGISYEAVVSGRYIYGDAYSSSESLAVPDLDKATFRTAVAALFASIKASEQYDYVIVDTRGGFAFESTDVCALADSFIVITEPDYTSFYQDRNLVRRISDAAKELNSRPLLRSIIVNKATEGEQNDGSIDLQKMERSFRVELEKEFPVKFLDTHPIPIDVEALKAYKTQRIPYLAAPASLFSFATLSAFRDILQVVTARWTEEQVQRWNSLIETVSNAIAARNKLISEEKDRQLEIKKQLTVLQVENQSLRDRAEEFKREMERLDHRYERELQRTTGKIERPRSSAVRTIAIATTMIFLVVAGIVGVWWFQRSSTATLLQHAYDENIPLALRISEIGELARKKGYRNFDGIKLPGARLSGIPLDGASFRAANLSGASFRQSPLSSTDFSDANLSGADFTQAKLGGALFRNAILTGATLDQTDLRGADLTGAMVSPDQWKTSNIDDHTILPRISSPNGTCSNVLQADPQAPSQIRTNARSELSISQVQILAGYMYDIFVLDTDQQNQQLAAKVKQFIEMNIGGRVRIKVKQQSFFDNVAMPIQNEVRFSGARRGAAEALVALLNSCNPDLRFTTRETVTPYSNYLTVFLWK